MNQEYHLLQKHKEDSCVITPCDPSYQKARQGWNRAVQQFPSRIIYCRTAEDVAASVCLARKKGLPLRVRNGGHNYEGYSNGDCAVVIDVSKMNQLEINESAGLLRVGGGVNNRQLYEFVSTRGYPFPGGTCPTVGVSGYALGGGWGLSCRHLGLGCDSLEEVKLVNAEGELITANQRINQELFWACRGAGGGNFGVIVSMLFRLPQKVGCVTLIELDYLHAGAVRQKCFLETWSEWFAHADSRMTLQGRVYQTERDGAAMLLRGIFYGEPHEARQMLRGFFSLEPTGYSLSYVPFLEAVRILGSGYPPYEKFASVSRFACRNYIAEYASELTRMIQESPPGSVFSGLSLYALGGRVAETGVDETAFYYRNADMILWLETVWEEDRFAKENQCWIKERLPYLASITMGSYVNFPYRCLPCPLEEYYGPHVDRLRAVKLRYDPCNIFTFPQGIFPASICKKFRRRREFAEPLDETGEKNYREFRYAGSTEMMK